MYDQERTEIRLVVTGPLQDLMPLFTALQDTLKAHGSATVSTSTGHQSPALQVAAGEWTWEHQKLLKLNCELVIAPPTAPPTS